VFLDASQLASDVEQFPLLVRLPADQFDFNHLTPDGTYLLVEDGLTGQLLPHVLEFLSENRGAVLFVQVPRLQGRSVDGLLWLYYGGPSRSEAEKPKRLCDDHTLVLRFQSGPQGELTVTQPGVQLRAEGPVHLTEGVVGAALEVQGDGMVQVELPPNFAAQDTQAWTLEACAYDVNPNPSLGVGHGLISLWAALGPPRFLLAGPHRRGAGFDGGSLRRLADSLGPKPAPGRLLDDPGAGGAARPASAGFGFSSPGLPGTRRRRDFA
jgi:hypothetical protein